jgi:hypothetical protein
VEREALAHAAHLGGRRDDDDLVEDLGCGRAQGLQARGVDAVVVGDEDPH